MNKIWIAFILVILAVHPVSALADLDNNGKVDFNDLIATLNLILSHSYNSEADIDGNGVINFNDLIGVLNAILAGGEPLPSPGPQLKASVIYYEPYPLAFYNAFYELNVPQITFNITNLGNEPVTVKLTSEYQGYSNQAITTQTIMPNETLLINQTIPLIRSKIEQIETKTKFSLHYKIEYEDDGGWKVWDEQTVMIDVYPMDTMVWAGMDSEGNLINLDPFIAVFVTPTVDEINQLLGVAKEYATDDYGNYSANGLYRSLPGYQCDWCNPENYWLYTALQVMAIYNALNLSYGISYVNTPIAFGSDAVQQIKVPRKTLETRSGNCIDLTVLFASAIEALGMHPFIVLLPHHAFVAWCTDPNCTYIDALETTMIGQSNFTVAYAKGLYDLHYKYWANLTDGDPLNGQIIDVKYWHDHGILPME